MLEGRAPVVRGGLFFSAVLSSIFSAYACYSRGILSVHWTCKMFNGPWRIIVLRASWLEHPTLIIIKKKLSSSIQASSLTVHSWYLARTFSFNCPFFAFYFFVKYEGEEITS
jgi:hypothetical protein